VTGSPTGAGLRGYHQQQRVTVAQLEAELNPCCVQRVDCRVQIPPLTNGGMGVTGARLVTLILISRPSCWPASLAPAG